MTDDLDTLFELAGNTGEPDDWNGPFDAIGLIFQIPPRRERYWCTPLNCLTFARTGGDGTHYSIVDVPGEARGRQPIVMTVPMSDDPNVIVGENLREFLALGCRYGYFGLEGLVHQFDETIAELELRRFDSEISADEVVMLEALAQAFALQPWDSPRTRLAELKLRHYAHLDIPSPP